MDLEDLFKGKHRSGYGHDHHDKHHYEKHDRRDDPYDDHAFGHMDHPYPPRQRGHFKTEMISSILRSLPHKKTLLTVAAIAAAIVLFLGIALLWALIPVFMNMVQYVEVNGIQGLIDTLLVFIQKIMKGTG